MKKTRLTTYHPKGIGLIENIHNTIRNMLKARAEGDPQKSMGSITGFLHGLLG